MPRISVMTQSKARLVSAPERCAAAPAAFAYYDSDRPLHLHLHEIAPGQVLPVERSDADRLAYVWSGAVDAGGHRLAQGSSLIVEHGGSLAIACGDEPSRVLVFSAPRQPDRASAGGNIHILPVDRVARSAVPGDGSGVAGGMHFASDCPTCEIWLHENHFPGMAAPTPEDQARGVHSHSEDEIIFVTAGEIRLGNGLYGPGTALAIAADTLYSFTAGPDGLSFINFRAAMPGDIRFASGASISETAYSKERVARPEYLEPV